jgi:uncharacterized protein with ParB-like and HNH nuclease domain
MRTSEQFVDTSPYSFKGLCKQYEKFQIPNFQRSYSWKNKQFSELFSAIIENKEGYFIGNIVALTPTHESDDRLTIIDGQQRLTSISLLLLAIRDEINNLEITDDTNRLKKKIGNYLLGEDLDRGTAPDSNFERLRPGKKNLMEVYEKLLKQDIDFADRNLKRRFDKSQLVYIRNYESARKLINRHAGTSIEVLETLVNKIISLNFIAIVCANEGDVYNLFEGLNSKGLGLSVADLVKNALLRRANELGIESEIEGNWLELEALFEKTDTSLFPKFLRHQWIAERGYISNSDLYEKIKLEKIATKDQEEIRNYSSSLYEDARFYIGVAFSDELLVSIFSDKKIQETLKRFRLLNNQQVYELLLSYYHRFLNDQDFKPRNFTWALDRLWIFAFRARFVSINPSDYERKFAEHCLQISSLSNTELLVEEGKFYKLLFSLVSSADQFIKNFSEEIGYDSDRKLTEYVLSCLFLDENSDLKHNDPNIEHIVPQRPKEWGLNESDVRDYVHSIGNLTILSSAKNTKAGNKSMSFKCEYVYALDAFDFNRKLLILKDDFEINPKEAVWKRGKELSEKTEDLFRF